MLLSTEASEEPLPPLAADLIARMADPDASKRFTLEQVLSHPWTRGLQRE